MYATSKNLMILPFLLALKLTITNHAVFAKTAGLLDKTAKFQKCPTIFVSLSDSMSDEKINPENSQTV